jgi:hypothetical protein
MKNWMRDAAEEIVEHFNQAGTAFQFGMAWENSTEQIIAKHAAAAPERKLFGPKEVMAVLEKRFGDNWTLKDAEAVMEELNPTPH